MVCSQCGNEIEETRYCPYCGCEQGEQPEPTDALGVEADPDGGVAAEKAEAAEAAANLDADAEAGTEAEGEEDTDADTVDAAEGAEEADAGASGSHEIALAKSTDAEGASGKAKRGVFAIPEEKRALYINGGIFAALAVFIGFAIGTAVHWEKVDIPEHPETFHTEQRDAGYWTVTMDSQNPCYVGQSWSECIDRYVNEYNNACIHTPSTVSSKRGGVYGGVGVPVSALWSIGGTAVTFSDWLDARRDAEEKGLDTSSAALCSRYSEMIDDMRAQDGGYGWHVVTLGSWGHLHAERKYETVRVSNNDYVPAVTHDAVCYLGFIGECDMPEDG